MPSEEIHGIPITTVYRLSQYYRALADCGGKGFISSRELAGLTGFNDALLRKDLSYFGRFGVPGRGYRISELRGKIFDILGINREWKIALIGLGNLGRALIKYRGFEKKGFRVVSVLDKDPGKIGRIVYGMKVKDIKSLKRQVGKNGVNMAVITVPAPSAEEVIVRVINSGVRAILNFAPVKVKVPGDVCLVNIDIGLELEKLSFLAVHKKNWK